METDFLCYVTPSEHLGLPDVDDVRQGVLAARVAGHAADLVRRIPGAWEWDEKMSRARKNRDWAEQIRLAIDPEWLARFEREPAVKIMKHVPCAEICALTKPTLHCEHARLCTNANPRGTFSNLLTPPKRDLQHGY